VDPLQFDASPFWTLRKAKALFPRTSPKARHSKAKWHS
jgi:hypothetical protein